MSDELDLERRVELIEKELDLYPQEADFKDRVRSYYSPALEFEHFVEDNVAVFKITRNIQHNVLEELSEAFGEYELCLNEQVVRVYND